MNIFLTLNDIHLEDLVDSLNHPLAIYLRDLLNRESRLQAQEIIIDDIENIEQALKAGVRLKKWFVSGSNIQIPQTLYQQLNKIPGYEIAPRTCKKIFENDKMSRMFAIADLPSLVTSINNFTSEKDLVVLDGVSITGNVGAIIRTATALNAGSVIILNANIIDIYDRRIIRASRGYIFNIPVIAATLDEFLAFCKREQFITLMASAHATETIDSALAKKSKLAIILGSEKEGESKELNPHIDVWASIPMNSIVESLNVSVAASIILYMRQFLKNTSKIH